MTGRAFAAASGVLCLLAGALLGLLAWEWCGTPGEDAAPVRPGVARPAPAASRAAPDTAGQAAAALARPLFEPSRRPSGGTDAAVAELPRLTAVLVSGAGRVALFAGPAGGRATTVPVGGTLGAFTVRAVEPGQVVIDGPSGTRVLRPSFEGARPVAAEAPPPRPVSVGDLLRDGAPPYPPTPGLPSLLGAAGQPRPPQDASNQVPTATLLGAPFPGIGVPGLPPTVPGGPPPAPTGPQ